MPPDRFYHIVHLGCAKNQVDAELMAASLEKSGWTWEPDPARADVVLLNSCSFIEPAQVESIDTTFELVRSFPDSHVIMTGCLSQRFSKEIAAEVPELGGVFGNRNPTEIVDLVSAILDAEPNELPIVRVPRGGATLSSMRRPRLFSHPGSAYVKIAEGCDHRCSFCDIPNIRGRHRSRPLAEIVSETQELLSRGTHEINLIAQDLVAYDRPDALSLVEAILHGNNGPFWLRPLYVYPDSFPLRLVDISREDTRLVPYFDIPFQHADPFLLKRMGRSGSAAHYLDLILEIRRRNPAATIRTSLIVGFPGETEDHFVALLDFVKAAEIDWLGVFAYSPQAGTPAMRWVEKGELPDSHTSERRRREIEEIQEVITSQRLQRFVGTRHRVLIEEKVVNSAMALARGAMHAPDVDGLVIVHGVPETVLPGNVVTVDIRDVRGVDMNAEMVGSSL